MTAIARKHRDWLLKQNEIWTQQIFRFLAYVNQSNWQAAHLLRIIDAMQNRDEIQRLIFAAENDFQKKNIQRLFTDKEVIPDHQLEGLLSITKTQPLILGIVDAADNWVVENYKDVARLPNENEWLRLLASSLDGQVGMSFALQCRYNFGRIFR